MFETISIDLFCPLAETEDGKKWIFRLEDFPTKRVEHFALNVVIDKECTVTLQELIFMRYSFLRRINNNNCPQFAIEVMQQLCFFLDVKK